LIPNKKSQYHFGILQKHLDLSKDPGGEGLPPPNPPTKAVRPRRPSKPFFRSLKVSKAVVPSGKNFLDRSEWSRSECFLVPSNLYSRGRTAGTGPGDPGTAPGDPGTDHGTGPGVPGTGPGVPRTGASCATPTVFFVPPWGGWCPPALPMTPANTWGCAPRNPRGGCGVGGGSRGDPGRWQVRPGKIHD